MKPMLLNNDEVDLETLDYSNMFISIKRDGIRAEVSKDGILNRSLKKLRNSKVQDYFKEVYSNLPEDVILEAEIYSESTPCREVAGICNSLNHDLPSDLKMYFFGIYHPTLSFEDRKNMLDQTLSDQILKDINRYEIVDQHRVICIEDVEKFYNACTEAGYEGSVLMDGSKRYKCGRVTILEHIGFKLKPSREDDLLIIGVTERMENLNESETNELGRSFKRNTVDAKKSLGIAATFICLLDNGEECKVTITGEEETRKEIWENRNDYIGKYAVVKSMNYGTKTSLRHPRLIKVKEQIEK